MRNADAILRAVFARPFAVVAVLVAGTLGGLLWRAEQRNVELARETRWLQQRLADRRAMVARQRQEMASVADAVDHVVRTATQVRERATQARRLAHMEESHDVGYDVLPVRAMLDGQDALVSEDAARALQQLVWLDGNAAQVDDSLAVVTALLKTTRDAATRAAVPGIWPVRGPVTSRFGRRLSPYDGTALQHHAGVDISARWGTPVKAAADGSVVFAGRDGGYGGLVIVDHGGQLDTFYAHLSALYVREGQPVRRGQAIGAVGDTGRATGAHLHYEVRLRGNPVDPRRYLGS
jgi:murein DD-endopeptidase MepM/ murein hydrolase activator NlpD